YLVNLFLHNLDLKIQYRMSRYAQLIHYLPPNREISLTHHLFQVPTSISSVIPVISIILSGNDRCGFAKLSNVSIGSPWCIFTPASSIMTSYVEDKPVVSTSNTIYVPSLKSKSVVL